MQTRSYDKDDQKLYVTDVVADQVILLGGKGEGEGNGGRAQTATAGARNARGKAPVEEFAGITNEDVPF